MQRSMLELLSTLQGGSRANPSSDDRGQIDTLIERASMPCPRHNVHFAIRNQPYEPCGFTVRIEELIR